MMNQSRPQSHTSVHTSLRRAGILSVALFLIACSVGLGYVVHLTQRAASELQPAGQPSLLPLAALAVIVAIGGIAAFRAALRDSNEI